MLFLLSRSDTNNYHQIRKVVFIFIVYQLESAVLKTGKEDHAEEKKKYNKSKQNQDYQRIVDSRNCKELFAN